jgi:hypothetical protein
LLCQVGGLLVDGLGDGAIIEAPHEDLEFLRTTSFGLLQVRDGDWGRGRDMGGAGGYVQGGGRWKSPAHNQRRTAAGAEREGGRGRGRGRGRILAYCPLWQVGRTAAWRSKAGLRCFLNVQSFCW